MIDEILASALGGLITGAIGARGNFRVRVRDGAMRPVYQPGIDLIATRVKRRRIRFGEVVVTAPPDPELGWEAPEACRPDPARMPPGAFWVRRVAHVPGGLHPDTGEVIPADHYYLRGDSDGGWTDSRAHGLCPRDLICGVLKGSRITVPVIWPPKT